MTPASAARSACAVSSGSASLRNASCTCEKSKLRASSSRIGRPAKLTSASEAGRSEEHTSELQSLMRTSYAVFCLTKNNSTVSTPEIQAHHTRQTLDTENTKPNTQT